MDKKELLIKYELMIIVDAKHTGEAKESIYKEVTDTVVKGGGKIISSQVWIEKHRLTYPIKKQNEGTYYLVNFESDGQAVKKIEPMLRLNERILRYLISRVETHTGVVAVKV